MGLAAYFAARREADAARRDRRRLLWLLAVAAAPRWLAVAMVALFVLALLLTGGRP